MDARGILNSTAFFNVVLTPDQLDQLAASAREVHFRRGDVLMRQRELGEKMYVLADGKVTVSVHEPGGEKTIATLAPGDVVGEMAVITGERRTATVKAKGKVTALEITKADLGPLIAAEPNLAERFGSVIEQRHAELVSRNNEARRWLSVGVGRDQIAAHINFDL